MTIGSVLQKPWPRWPLALLFWTLIGLSFASQFYSSAAKAGLEVTWKQAVTYALGDWYVFALLSIPVIQLARHFHFETGKWGATRPGHLFRSFLFSLTSMLPR